jgi:hypothetical protein
MKRIEIEMIINKAYIKMGDKGFLSEKGKTATIADLYNLSTTIWKELKEAKN